jgi:hypothetical protein
MQKSLVDNFVMSFIKNSGSKIFVETVSPCPPFHDKKMVQWCQGREQTKT